MDCSPPGSSVHGILQARILEWLAILSSRGSSWPRYWTQVSCIEGWLFTISVTRKTHFILFTIYFGIEKFSDICVQMFPFSQFIYSFTFSEIRNSSHKNKIHFYLHFILLNLVLRFSSVSAIISLELLWLHDMRKWSKLCLQNFNEMCQHISYTI